jgi:hypothetical protein
VLANCLWAITIELETIQQTTRLVECLRESNIRPTIVALHCISRTALKDSVVRLVNKPQRFDCGRLNLLDGSENEVSATDLLLASNSCAQLGCRMLCWERVSVERTQQRLSVLKLEAFSFNQVTS